MVTVGRTPLLEALASPSTLCRFENAVTRATPWAVREVGYIVGLARNARLKELAEPVQAGRVAAHPQRGR